MGRGEPSNRLSPLFPPGHPMPWEVNDHGKTSTILPTYGSPGAQCRGATTKPHPRRGLYSYDEARAGYVGRAAADVSLGNLVASLSHLDSSLMRNFQAVMDRKIERDVAAGRVAFEENRGENKNRLDWKAASEANPELQNSTPMLSGVMRRPASNLWPMRTTLKRLPSLSPPCSMRKTPGHAKKS